MLAHQFSQFFSRRCLRMVPIVVGVINLLTGSSATSSWFSCSMYHTSIFVVVGVCSSWGTWKTIKFMGLPPFDIKLRYACVIWVVFIVLVHVLSKIDHIYVFKSALHWHIYHETSTNVRLTFGLLPFFGVGSRHACLYVGYASEYISLLNCVHYWVWSS